MQQPTPPCIAELSADDCPASSTPSPAGCAFAGDSTSGVFARRLAGVPVIGHANRPGKAELLGRD